MSTGPAIDEESRPYWEGLREERLRIQRCTGCGAHRFPPLPACPRCGAAEREWVDSAGRGRLYAWIRVHQAFAPELEVEVPYVVATVELEEGVRLVARLEDGVEPEIDAALAVRFVHHPDWSEARFAAPDAGATAIGTPTRSGDPR